MLSVKHNNSLLFNLLNNNSIIQQDVLSKKKDTMIHKEIGWKGVDWNNLAQERDQF